jgi:hypothetical protein
MVAKLDYKIDSGPAAFFKGTSLKVYSVEKILE